MQQYTINEEQSPSKTSAEKDQNNSPLISHEPIKGSPFVITGDINGYYLRIGNMKLTEHYETKNDVLCYMTANHWELILKLTLAVIEIHKNLHNQ